MKWSKVSQESEWEEMIKKFPEATFIDSWSWGEFNRTVGHDNHYYKLVENDIVVALLPFTFIDAKRGKYIHVRHAPLLDFTNVELVHEVTAFLREQATVLNADFIRISPHLQDTEENSSTLRMFKYRKATNHEVDAEHTLIIDLTKSEKELLSEMRKNTRYSIRKAEKLGVETISTDGSEYFDTFWEIFSDAVVRNKWVAFKKSYLKQEYEIFAKKKQARMFLSRYNGKFISAAIFIYYNGQSFYHHSGSLSEFREIPATYQLQWEAIKYARSIGMREHNLWGVVDKEDSSHPWYGLSLFKWGFGGTERKNIHSHDLRLKPWAYAVSLYEWLESKKGGY